MRIQFLNRSYVLALFLAFFSINCSKTDNPEPPQPAPTITGFSPSAAGEGEQVIITGTNFKVVPSNNIVKFNGTTATISAATMTQLTVTVPAGVTSGKISVSVNNQTATSSTDFIFLGTVSTLAGSGAMGFVNGTGSAAQFGSAPDLAVDAAGNIYVADATSSFAVRKITPAGVVTTLAGNGIRGFVDGTGSEARFGVLMGIAVDGSGNVYVADLDNARIRKISPDGVVTTIGGTGMDGYVDGPAATSQFRLPMGVVADNAGNVYVADAGNNRIRKISGGIVSTIAGDGLAGSVDGAAATARFNNPMKIKIDAAGNLIVLDQSNHRIRKISTAGTVSTIAGSGTAGYLDGTAATAQFNYPAGLAIDQNGNIYVGDQLNQRIRKISTDGVVTTLAGTGVAGFDDGNTNNAKFHNPNGLDITSTGIIYVADNRNFRIRKITF
jgi:hypothetical protein